MNSKEALERIKSKYKGCLVKEAHELPFSYDINIENIEEYWHIENKNDFSQIEKDLEILEILKKKGVAVGFIQLQITENCGGFIEYNDYIGEDKSLHLTADEYEEIKEWLDK